MNRHLNRYNWATENLLVILENEVSLPGLTEWCGIHSGGIVGPYFFVGTANYLFHLEMLRKWGDWLRPQIHDRNFILQEDGARIVRSFLDDRFPIAWIGRRRWNWIDSPARSLDLTHIYPVGLIKDKVHSKHPKL